MLLFSFRHMDSKCNAWSYSTDEAVSRGAWRGDAECYILFISNHNHPTKYPAIILFSKNQLWAQTLPIDYLGLLKSEAPSLLETWWDFSEIETRDAHQTHKLCKVGAVQTNKAVQHKTEFLRNWARGALGQQYPGQLRWHAVQAGLSPLSLPNS